MQSDGDAEAITAPPAASGVDRTIWQEAEASIRACISRELGRLREDAEEAGRRWDALMQDKTAAELENAVLEDRLTEALARAGDADQEAEELRNCVGLMKNDLATKKNRLVAAKERIRELDVAAARAAEHIDRLETENRDFKKVSRVVALENAFARLEQENKRLHAALRDGRAAPLPPH